VIGLLAWLLWQRQTQVVAEIERQPFKLQPDLRDYITVPHRCVSSCDYHGQHEVVTHKKCHNTSDACDSP
jgi:hypothetical protein